MGTGPAEPGSCAPGPASSWLQMFGLAAAVTTTYLIACAATGDIPALTDNSVPVRLFQMSGLYGMDRRYVEVAWQTTQAGIVGMAALGICDLVYARRTQARWFALHVIANFWISLLCMPDLYFVLSNPVEAIKTRTTGHWPTAIVFSVHLYHMFFFRKLQWIDWMHHILMVCIGAPLLITGEIGPLMNFNNFWMCGVPGGADYAMLFAVKHGWMHPLSEKSINKSINVWVRAPSLVFVSCLCWLQFHLQQGPGYFIGCVRVFLLALASWNGLFFMERVVGNYHVCAYKANHAEGPKGGKAAPGGGHVGSHSPMQHEARYASDEHISGVNVLGELLPGIGGMRVSVSMQELDALGRARAAWAAAAGRPKRAAHTRSTSYGGSKKEA